MKICHTSDWHGSTIQLPRADLYVLTGDMLPTFPLVSIKNIRTGKIATRQVFDPLTGKRLQVVLSQEEIFVGRKINHQHEKDSQTEWCKTNQFRSISGVDEKSPVIIVRGNHDFAPLNDWVGGENYEFTDDPTIVHDVMGVKFGGCRGIRKMDGEWNDELDEQEFYKRVSGIPEHVDVLVTHSPPFKILDMGTMNWGSRALRKYVMGRFSSHKDLEAHLFGHVHEACGMMRYGGALFSNAATRYNIIDI